MWVGMAWGRQGGVGSKGWVCGCLGFDLIEGAMWVGMAWGRQGGVGIKGWVCGCLGFDLIEGAMCGNDSEDGRGSKIERAWRTKGIRFNCACS
jgi:hypothetical protein